MAAYEAMWRNLMMGKQGDVCYKMRSLSLVEMGAMMRVLYVFIAVFVLILMAPERAQARRSFPVGEQTNLTEVEDIALPGPDGEDLTLDYKTTTFFLGLGVYMTDDGYVMGIKEEPGSYYPLPDGEKLALLQKIGMMPDPLPEYSIDPKEWAFGFGWVLLILLTIIWGFIKSKFSRKPA